MAKGFFGKLFGRKKDEQEQALEQEGGIVAPEEESKGADVFTDMQEDSGEAQKEAWDRDLEEVPKEDLDKEVGGEILEEALERDLEEEAPKEGLDEEAGREVPGEALDNALEETGKALETLLEGAQPVEEEKPKEKKGFFKRLVSGLSKTRKQILSGINGVFHGFSNIDEDFYEELEEILVMADIGVSTTTKILDDLREKVKERKIKEPMECRQLLIDSIKAQMQVGENAYEFEKKKSVVLLIGVNGVGKTTSVGKLAGQLKAKKKKVLMAAADTFRAAAIEQLTEWSNRAGVEIIAQKEGSDPAAVIFDAVTAAKARNTDVLLCDTAGRLHNKKNLMEELKKIDRVISREYPDAYRENFVVLDGTTGQNALVQAKEFSEVAKITGVILTKMDATAKGGIAIAVQSELGIPVKYIGIGEKIDDLQKFNADDFVDALFAEESD